MDIAHPREYQEVEDLPECKIKRNYSCSHCSYYTQNPRFYLTHKRDVHGERITISNCSLCLYASRHYQKLVRHMKMVHGSTAESIPGQLRKRPLAEDVSDCTLIPPLPTPSKWIIDIDNFSYDLKSSRKTLKDIAAIYFAENDDYVKEVFAKMEASDVVEVVPKRYALPSIEIPPRTVFGDPKFVGLEELDITCSCGHASKCISDLVIHGKSCSQSNEKDYESAPLNLCIRWSNESWSTTNSTSDKRSELINKEEDSKNYQLAKFNRFCKISDENSIKDNESSYKHGSEHAEKLKNKSQEEKVKIEEPELHHGEEVNTRIVSKEESRTLDSHKKVFKCPLCPFWASTASRFHVHIVGHQNKKSFKCSLCAYCSNWRWDITKHIRLRAIRSPSHKNARVLMQGENGRCNYTKYEKFITLMKMSDIDGDLKSKKCGEMTSNIQDPKVTSRKLDTDMLKETITDDKETKLKEEQEKFNSSLVQSRKVLDSPSEVVHNYNNSRTGFKQNSPRSYLILEDGDEPSYKCSKCHFRHSNRDAVLVHVKIHHEDLLKSSLISFKSMNTMAKNNEEPKLTPLEEVKSSLEIISTSKHNTESFFVDVENDNTGIVPSSKKDFSSMKKSISDSVNPSVKDSLKIIDNMGNLMVNDGSSSSYNDNYAPYRCWHCHQTSNWKHVIQRHCRLKHSGSIRIEAIDRTTNANNPVYRMLYLSSNSEVSPSIQPENKTDKPSNCDKNSKNQNNFSIDSNAELTTKMHHTSVKSSRKSPLNVKRAEQKFLKFECKDCHYVSSNKIHLSQHYAQKHKQLSIVQKKPQKICIEEKTVNSPSVLSEENETPVENSSNLEKCDYCSFVSSCHSAIKCHQQSHHMLLNQKDIQKHKSNIKEGTCSDSERNKVVTGTTEHLTSNVNIDLTLDVTDSIQNIENASISENTLVKTDSEVNRQMDKIEKEIQLKIKHIKMISNVNSSNYKKTSSIPTQSSRKTIFVNPKTGQIVRRN